MLFCMFVFKTTVGTTRGCLPIARLAKHMT